MTLPHPLWSHTKPWTMHHSILTTVFFTIEDLTKIKKKNKKKQCSVALHWLFCLKRKTIHVTATKLRFTIHLGYISGEKHSLIVSFQHVTGPHLQFVGSFHSPWKSYPWKHRRCFSFSFPVSIWHRKEKKKSHSPSNTSIKEITNTLELAKLWFFDNSNFTPQPWYSCPYWFL